MARPIILVGLPGAGKTTVGAALAKALGCRFLDSDQEIERQTGLTVAQLFETRGEAEFRALEARIVGELLGGSDSVIALGGGAFDNEHIRNAVNANCLSIWLDVAIDEIDARLGRDFERPLLPSSNRLEALHGLAAKRREYYSAADIRLTEPSLEASVARIIKLGVPRLGR